MGFVLDGSELRIFDVVTSDQTVSAGEEVNYYSVNKQTSKVDPLYGEYKHRQVDGPWRLPAAVAWPARNPQSTESGFTVEFDSQCVIARYHLDKDNVPYPTEGDMIEMFRSPYADADSMGQGYFFDIIKITADGHLNDTGNFTKFTLVLKRRPQYAPERKLENLP